MPKNNKNNNEGKKSELDSKSENSNKSFLFNFVDNLQSNAEDEKEKIKRIEKKSEKNPAINLLLNNFVKSNRTNSQPLFKKETKQEKKQRKENQKNLKRIQKQNNEEIKLLQKQAREERKKYLYEKSHLATVELQINENILKLEKNRIKLLKQIKEEFSEETIFKLNETVQNHAHNLTSLAVEIKNNNQLIQNSSISISNFIRKTPKKLIPTYNLLRKEYLLGDRNNYSEIAQNQILFNRPWSKNKIESEINKMKMTQKYMNHWNNTHEIYLKKCPGGCTSAFGKPKRVYRDLDSARKFALENQYTYFDSNCGLGFHNSSRKEVYLTDKTVESWTDNFEKILNLNSLQVRTLKLVAESNEIEKDIKSIESKILNKQNFDSTTLNNIENEIDALKDNLRSQKILFEEKEHNYLTVGQFLTDVNLQSSA